MLDPRTQFGAIAKYSDSRMRRAWITTHWLYTLRDGYDGAGTEFCANGAKKSLANT